MSSCFLYCEPIWRNVLKRSTLLSDVGGSPFRDSTDTEEGGISGDRARLLRGTSLLESGSKRLQDAQRVALETEEQGADILRDLRRQREQIENSRETVCGLEYLSLITYY